MHIKIRKVLEIPEKYFNKEFLDTEAKKRLAIRGDQLMLQFKVPFNHEAKTQYATVFTKDCMYLVIDNKNGNIIFVES